MILPTPITSDSPFRAEEVVYLRLRLHGFEQFIGWENTGTKDVPKYVAVTKPEVAWVTPIDKDGKPIEGAPCYQIRPEWMIHPAAVKQDVKDTLGKAVQE